MMVMMMTMMMMMMMMVMTPPPPPPPVVAGGVSLYTGVDFTEWSGLLLMVGTAPFTTLADKPLGF
jgi:hypothetical protein